MRVNCGDCRTVREVKETERIKRWHPFFCIWPRRMTYSDIENDCRVFEKVLRRGTWHRGYFDVPSHWTWEYKPY